MPFAGSFNVQASFGGITEDNIDSGTAAAGEVLTADGSGGAAWQGPKKYVALLTQTGENAPVATVLENTLGGTPVWTRTNTGIYHCALNGMFTQNKTVIFLRTIVDATSSLTSSSYRISTGYTPGDIVLSTGDPYSQEGLDGVLDNWPIEIRVYP